MTATKTVAEILGDKYTPAMKEAFPDVDPGIYPYGYLLVVQLRTPKKKTTGGIILIDETRDDEIFRSQFGLVRSMGPSAFKRRDTLEPWPEGDWCKVGSFVRSVLYGGDRWYIPSGNKDQQVLFVATKDTDLIGELTADPLSFKVNI